jgi:shikimate dehydrogenase
VRYVRVEGPADTDALLAALPPSSLVANATGMGKDVPGSPPSHQATFPQHAVVWDGWRYFVHGWSQVVADVFTIPMPRETVQEPADIAVNVRA